MQAYFSSKFEGIGNAVSTAYDWMDDAYPNWFVTQTKNDKVTLCVAPLSKNMDNLNKERIFLFSVALKRSNDKPKPIVGQLVALEHFILGQRTLARVRRGETLQEAVDTLAEVL